MAPAATLATSPAETKQTAKKKTGATSPARQPLSPSSSSAPMSPATPDADGAPGLYDRIYARTSSAYAQACQYLPPPVVEKMDFAVLSARAGLESAKTMREHPEQLEAALLQQYHVPAPLVEGGKQALITAYHVQQRARSAASSTTAAVSTKVTQSVERARSAVAAARRQALDTALNVATAAVPVVERVYAEQAAPLLQRAYVIAEPYVERAKPYASPYVERAKPYVDPVVQQVKDVVEHVRTTSRQRQGSELATPRLA